MAPPRKRIEGGPVVHSLTPIRPPFIKEAGFRIEELAWDPIRSHPRFQALLEGYRDDVEH